MYVRGSYPQRRNHPARQGEAHGMQIEGKLTPAAPRGQVLRDDRAYEGLTPQQWHYARYRASGLSITEAYERAYEPDPDLPRLAVSHMAAGVEANPKVQAKLRRLLAEAHGDTSLIPKIDEDFVLTGIAQIAVTSTKDSTRLRGYELLGKAIGLFDKADAAPPPMKTVGDIDAELRKRLSTALAPEVIDQTGEPEPASVEPTPGESRGRDRRRKPRAVEPGEG